MPVDPLGILRALRGRPGRSHPSGQVRLTEAQRERTERLGIRIRRGGAGYEIAGFGSTSSRSGIDDLLDDYERERREKWP